jgi:hypothetical protein
MPIAPPERLGTPGYPERVADLDRPICARQVELVARLRVEPRLEALAGRLFATESEHVGRDVAAVNVESAAQQGHEQAARPTGEIEGRLPIPVE